MLYHSDANVLLLWVNIMAILCLSTRYRVL